MELKSRNKLFGGYSEVYEHASDACACPMTFSFYRPPQAEDGPVPVLYWLSGLTCTQENFTTKAGAQRYAAEQGIALVAPDTSPRGTDLPGEHERYDFGSGAGFYVNATVAPWCEHYRMDDYVTKELPTLVNRELPVLEGRQSVAGHSMGGHGAIVLALRNPGLYRSVSAFSPICAPSQCDWGRGALAGYLGDDESAWHEYDASYLAGHRDDGQALLVDQGADDEFLTGQLQPDRLEAACLASGRKLHLRMHAGYDHSYFFIASFIGEHVAYHARALAAD